MRQPVDRHCEPAKTVALTTAVIEEPFTTVTLAAPLSVAELMTKGAGLSAIVRKALTLDVAIVAVVSPHNHWVRSFSDE